MTPLIVAAALSMLALDAGPSTSQLPAAAPTGVTGEHRSDADDPNKVLCRAQPIIGSRFVKRVCMTRAEWAEQERRSREWIRKFGQAAGQNAGNSALGNGN